MCRAYGNQLDFIWICSLCPISLIASWKVDYLNQEKEYEEVLKIDTSCKLKCVNLVNFRLKHLINVTIWRKSHMVMNLHGFPGMTLLRSSTTELPVQPSLYVPSLHLSSFWLFSQPTCTIFKILKKYEGKYFKNWSRGKISFLSNYCILLSLLPVSFGQIHFYLNI